MKKTNDIAKMLASELVGGGRIFDDSAETTEEISTKTGFSISSVNKHVAAKTKAGLLERVWKRVGCKPVPAYRVKR